MLERKRILIVEDEPIVAMMLEDMLENLGAIVVGPASSVIEANALIARGLPDAAVLDLNLGGERSHAVARQLRDKGVPFVFATGHTLVGDVDFAEATCVQKPYRSEQIAAALARVLGDGAG